MMWPSSASAAVSANLRSVAAAWQVILSRIGLALSDAAHEAPEATLENEK